MQVLWRVYPRQQGQFFSPLQEMRTKSKYKIACIYRAKIQAVFFTLKAGERMATLVKILDPLGRNTMGVTDQGAAVTLDYYNASVLDGNVYTGAIYSALTAGLTIKATFKTPADKSIRFLPIIITGLTGDLSASLYEGSSGNSGGTVAPPTNRNRQSSNTSSAIITVGQTVTTNGTLIGIFTMMHSSTPISANTSEAPLIMKKDTLYTLAITNASSSANGVTAELSFIED